MSSTHEREYIDKHELIMSKLLQMVEESGRGCISVQKIAVELGMDQRTVRSHLKSWNFITLVCSSTQKKRNSAPKRVLYC